jgi:hypothetical protein
MVGVSQYDGCEKLCHRIEKQTLIRRQPFNNQIRIFKEILDRIVDLFELPDLMASAPLFGMLHVNFHFTAILNFIYLKSPRAFAEHVEESLSIFF